MIVTARADAAPDAIAALWTDGLLDRIDIEPPGGVTTPEEVDAFIAELPAAARSVLDYLAVEEPLSLADLTALAGDGAVRQAEELGAAETRVRDERADPVVYTAHPLFAERALAALGGDGARRRRTELVKLLSQHPSDHLSDRLRLASLALDSDALQPVAEVVAAARAGAAAGRPRTRRTTGPLGAGAVRRPDGAAGAGPRPGVAGPRPRDRRRAGRRRLRRADRVGAHGLDAAAGGQPILDAQRAGAGHRVPAHHPQSGHRRRPAHHPRRAQRHVRDERRQRRARRQARPRGAGVAVGRRPGGGLGGQRGRTVLGAAGPVRRRRAAGASAPWPPSIPGCCASLSGWARPPHC